MIDLKKPVQTRDGKAARIICTDRTNSEYPVVALVYLPDDFGEQLETYTLKGRYSQANVDNPYDLVNVPEEKVTYLTYLPENLELRGCFSSESVATPRFGCYADGRVFFKLTRIDGVITKVELFK